MTELRQLANGAREALIRDLERVHYPDLARIRQSLAIGAFLRQELTLQEASELSALDPDAFARVLAERSTGNLEAEDVNPAPLPPTLSVVIPVYNEEENLPKLWERLEPILEEVGSYEVLFVNDGSRDRSVSMITQMRSLNPAVKLITFSRNFGHQAALTAGIEHSCGNAVVLMDADLQDPPEILLEFLERWKEGYQVVYAVRMKRKEGPLKRFAYYLFYRLLRTIANTEIALDSGDFCLMDRRVVQELRALPERNKFLRGLRSWIGFRQIGVTYERQARYAGSAKYTFKKLVKLALDGMLSFSSLPLRAASYIGFATAAGGAAYLLFAIVSHFFQRTVPQGWTSLIGIVLVLGGVQLIVLGVLGEYLARVYDETKCRPEYVLQETLGIER